MNFFSENKIITEEHEQFDMRQIPELQTRLDRYMDGMYGMIVDVRMIGWMYDNISEAENELRKWETRHPNDCHRVSSEPLSLRITLPIDCNYNKTVHDNYYKNKVPAPQKKKWKNRKKM